MQSFLTLAWQLFFIACMQSVLEVVASSRRQNHMQKPIALGCYVASLMLVLRFMQVNLFSELQWFLTYF